MHQPFRTPSGGRIDRTRPITFRFDGRTYQGYAGDTLASALLAAGVRLIGRSYKYHRPRGVMTAGCEEPNALVGVRLGPGRFTPNLRATQVPLVEGLEAESQNRWPSLQFDIGAVIQLGGAFFGPGFYYKTFMGPQAFGSRAWAQLFEPIIRQIAGLGMAPTESDPDIYAQFHDHCDVLVIGAGPAGLAAAAAAGRIGERVILCDEQDQPGGALLSETDARIDGMSAAEWLASMLADLNGRRNVRVMPRTQAFGYFAHNHLALSEQVNSHADGAPRERIWQVRAKRVVMAAGAIERPLVFANNDLPGIMLADAARIYLNRYGVRPGHRIVIATAHDSAYRTALNLKEAGVDIALVADLRPAADGALREAAMSAGIQCLVDCRIKSAHGKRAVSAVELVHQGQRMSTSCDALLMCGGWTPSIHLHSQSRGKIVFDETLQAFVPGISQQAGQSVGAARGSFGLAAALQEGAAAGGDPAFRPNVENDPLQSGGWLGEASGTSQTKAFVDFQNDVTAADIRQAVQEGMHSIEHVKRYTTSGMATDQGKLSNMNALAIAAAALGKPLPAVGLTTFRQPYTPVTFGALAGASRGDLFDPVRETPIHGWAAENGAVFEDVGLWKRAWYFPKLGETMQAAVARECRQVRATAGFFDASTLGKIEVVGPDAAVFLEKLYTNPWAKLEPGRCRYGLMLNEQGFVMDDGVIARLAPDRFHVTTTTSGAPRVFHHMEDYLQTEFPHIKVWLTSTTEQWAVIAVQGPKARNIIAPLVAGFDISAEAMPHMSIREGTVCGVEARVMRVSFTGELGFEVNVPADFGRAVWEALWAEGVKQQAVAYGTEAMHQLRADKGYIIVGQETDGTVTPDDLGLNWAIGKAKPDFVGKRSLVRPDMLLKNRKHLVGLLTEDPARVLEEGAQVTLDVSPALGSPALGHVTSAYRSETAGRSIALALVSGGRARMGETLYVPMPGGAIAVRVTEPVFFDPKGERLDA
ncbi:MAG: sarcosine oxidase subunit alpha family protein [Cupriavidus sp.]|nr:sarcosine oxidase subunit alpha family protein [Cupriavidus sp.]MCA3704382.1 sarcosine oxidase subunit alpha family protein [Methylobacterium sp.]